MAKGKVVLVVCAVAGCVAAGVWVGNRLPRREDTLFKPAPKNGGELLNAGLERTEANSADFRTAAKKILLSVVSIDTQVEGNDFFSGQHYVQDASSGSGVVLSPDGYIVTNNHVLSVQVGFGQRQVVDKVRVTFSDGKTVPAKIIGTDPRSDLAVIKVDASGVVPIEVGDNTKLEVGQWVIAVGNPLGYENTLSVGVVSNVGRQLPGSSDAVFIDGIQTDAAINPGNSGGALCNADGQLVGINSSIATTTRANIGIGFAIPINRVKQVVDDIVKFGYAKYGQIGVQVLRRQGVLGMREAREELQRRVGASTAPPSAGAVVLTVQGGSPAAAAGIKELDVITGIDGKKVADAEDYQKIVSPLRPDAKVALQVWSAGKEKTVNLTLADSGKASL